MHLTHNASPKRTLKLGFGFGYTFPFDDDSWMLEKMNIE